MSVRRGKIVNFLLQSQRFFILFITGDYSVIAGNIMSSNLFIDAGATACMLKFRSTKAATSYGGAHDAAL